MHLRLWLAERIADEMGAANLAGAPWMRVYARALGAKVGKHVDLHAIPPVTGLLTLGDGCSIEPEVDLRGHWIDGDVVHVGRVDVGAEARVGARSMLLPGADVGGAGRGRPGLGGLRRRAGRRGLVGGPGAARRRRPRPVGRRASRSTARAGWSAYARHGRR